MVVVVKRQRRQQKPSPDDHQRERERMLIEMERKEERECKSGKMVMVGDQRKKGGNEEFNNKKPDKSKEISGSGGRIDHLAIAMLGEEGTDLWKQRFEHDKVGRQRCSFGTMIVIGHR